MLHLLRKTWQNLRPVLTGWMLVALLLPSLLVLTPAVAATQANSFIEICQDKKEQLPGDHRNHADDCPCCLPTNAGLLFLPPRVAHEFIAPLVGLRQSEFAAAASTVIADSHTSHALARGPPSEPKI